ncbi:MAG: sugar phosphate isomerase/epimerase [Verrucomicrobia bacterium]|nr:sugar phosphate isomerase/epimerase [Verrucomicrobiota bacterium]
MKLGFDNYSLRSFGWKAGQFVDYAASLHLDALLFSDFEVYEKLSDDYLRDLKRRADDHGIALYAGMLSICPSSVIFDPKRGSAEDQLRLCLRLARTLGSPVARCVLGKVDDRRSPGGIAARIADTVKVLHACRTEALDSGVKIAVENHAGDLQSRELLALIETAGRDFVGVTMDAGNATWAMEHPLHSLELLGPHALCTGLRDSAAWETPDGAAFEWTALGDGGVDWEKYFARFAELCPHTPVILETISARQFQLPFRRDEFWAEYPRRRPEEFSRFMELARGGPPRPAPPDGLALDPEFQKAELERSLRYCREALGLGRRDLPRSAG